MRNIYLIVGLFILGLTVIDLIWTTLWVNGGAGPLSNRLATSMWRLMRKMTGEKDRPLSLAGPIILVLTLAMWVLLMWTGWSFVLAAEADTISDTMNGGEILWYERVYFVGYSLFTLGNGNYSPKEGLWQIVSTLISGTGMLFLTLGASYIISVVDAVVRKRAFASSITALSTEASTIVKEAWNGEGFHQLDLLLMNLSSELSALTQQHNAYPLLHYYYGEKSGQSAAVAVAALDEALTIIAYGVEPENRLNAVLLQNMRSTIQEYLETLDFARIASSDDVPRLPDLRSLRDAGIPVVSDEEFEANVEELAGRRKKLYGLIKANAREWPGK